MPRQDPINDPVRQNNECKNKDGDGDGDADGHLCFMLAPYAPLKFNEGWMVKEIEAYQWTSRKDCGLGLGGCRHVTGFGMLLCKLTGWSTFAV